MKYVALTDRAWASSKQLRLIRNVDQIAFEGEGSNERNWFQIYVDLVEAAGTGSFVVPRFYVEHDFGTRSDQAGIIDLGSKLLLYPPNQSLTDKSVKFYTGYWLQLLKLAQEFDAVLPVDYVIEYPGGESGNPWNGFLEGIALLNGA